MSQVTWVNGNFIRSKALNAVNDMGDIFREPSRRDREGEGIPLPENSAINRIESALVDAFEEIGIQVVNRCDPLPTEDSDEPESAIRL